MHISVTGCIVTQQLSMFKVVLHANILTSHSYVCLILYFYTQTSLRSKLIQEQRIAALNRNSTCMHCTHTEPGNSYLLITAEIVLIASRSPFPQPQPTPPPHVQQQPRATTSTNQPTCLYNVSSWSALCIGHMPGKQLQGVHVMNH